jgi:hypothetical protein
LDPEDLRKRGCATEEGPWLAYWKVRAGVIQNRAGGFPFDKAPHPMSLTERRELIQMKIYLASRVRS